MTTFNYTARMGCLDVCAWIAYIYILTWNYVGLDLNYIYVALISLWLYDYILCLPDAVTFVAKSRWGIGTFLYLACSHLPLAFILLNMLVVFRPDSTPHLCRSYNIANTYVGILTMFCAECGFSNRASQQYFCALIFALV
ncbi:hypothetical protein DEU56DRAFT_294069 [Suillus clintonianus]|uniref:uncharacterized protein n=1 Tax=Suillus clintonianus TaxID=1904413 RepID=UPI001B8812E0|nr:uncharacterized protein DEU56DRAFT_294069 [Suillus clintonianus]KAG2140122.1 hypothetical protein DEU56DRAFT_294069 [Suillus clintonianus]